MQVVSGSLVPRGAQTDGDVCARFVSAALVRYSRMRRQWRSPILSYRVAIAGRDHQPGATDQRAQSAGAQADGRSDGRSDGAADQPGAATFDEFYLRHEQALYGYLRRLLPTHEVAVELAQESFFRAWRHFDLVGAYDRPEAWLYRVATNLAISHLRRKLPLNFSALLARTRSDSIESEQPAIADLFAAPLDVEGQTAERDSIDRILRTLPERQRAALLLAAVQGFSADEIADALGVSPGNARQLLSRAREQFRRLYDEAQRPTP